MDPLRVERIALLHPGDMGSALGGALVAAGFCVSCCVEDRSPRTREAAARAGLARRETLPAALEDADLVVSLVPQEHALATARSCARALPPRSARSPGACGATSQPPIYLDANSLSPATARAVAAEVEAAGALCVDGAFLGSARDLRTRGKLLLSGGTAPDLAPLLARALPVRVVGPAVGDASGFKLCFSGFNKAVVAACLESLCAGFRAGFGPALLEALRDFYPGTLEALERQVPTYPRHAARRAVEMAEVAEFLGELGQAAGLAEAAAGCFRQVAAAALDPERRWGFQELLEELARVAALAARPEDASEGARIVTFPGRRDTDLPGMDARESSARG